VGDEMDRTTLVIDALCQLLSQRRDAQSPVEWLEVGVEACNSQSQFEFLIRQKKNASRDDARLTGFETEFPQIAA
jgi:hypothetical protein